MSSLYSRSHAAMLDCFEMSFGDFQGWWAPSLWTNDRHRLEFVNWSSVGEPHVFRVLNCKHKGVLIGTTTTILPDHGAQSWLNSEVLSEASVVSEPIRISIVVLADNSTHGNEAWWTVRIEKSAIIWTSRTSVGPNSCQGSWSSKDSTDIFSISTVSIHCIRRVVAADSIVSKREAILIRWILWHTCLPSREIPVSSGASIIVNPLSFVVAIISVQQLDRGFDGCWIPSGWWEIAVVE